MLLETGAYIKSYDRETKWMYFVIEDNELLETYNDIWNKVGNSIKKIDCEPIYNKKVLKTKTKSYSNKALDFPNNETIKVGSNYTCLAVILIDFVLKIEENYYP